MSMSKKNEKREIKQDQLLPEWGFLRFCNEDQANSYVGGRMEISEQFLRAAERDNLIKPILQIQGKIRQQDGTEKEGLVNYYSPHQIYLLAELRHNILDEDSNLRAPDTVDWYKERPKEQRPRYISWGRGMSFWAENPKKRDENEDNLWIGAHLLSEYMNTFLELLHSLEPIPRHLRTEEKQRFWNDASILEYNFEQLKKGGKRLLKNYGLDEKKLITLRHNIGQFAEMTDPLAHWYYYIKRHPEYKKDLLKGDASLAQEIYRLYDLLTEVWEVVTKEKAEPIFEFLHKDFGTPFYAPKTEYLHGEDIKALKYSVEQFKRWKRKKGNKSFVSDETMKKINAVEKELAEYEKLYGDRNYAGSMRSINEEDAIEFDKLDPRTKRYAEMILKQREGHKGVKPSEQEIKQEVAHAIMSRLGDLQRELRQIFWDISGQFREKENVAWQEINSNNLWMKLARDGKFEGLDHAQQVQLANTERKKIEKVAKDWKEKSGEFHKTVSWFTDLAFCQACRSNPIKLHKENVERDYWNGFIPRICDTCLKTKKLRTLPAGEYRCGNCGNLLLKFIHTNIINDLIFRQTSEMRIELEYGKIRVEVQCNGYKQCKECEKKMATDKESRCETHEGCKEPHIKFMEWGWLP